MGYVSNLKEYLLEHVPNTSLASGGRFLLTKCVFCGDGKHTTSRHMYICVENENEIPWCYCHLCHGTSRITPEFLSTYFNIYNIEFLTNLAIHNKKILSNPNNRHKIKDMEIYHIKNDYITENELSKVKLKYINKRLGTNLEYKDLFDLKIVLNLYDLLDRNNITKLTRDKKVVDELDKSFLGFISTDNAFVNLRNLRRGKLSISNIDKKYINYSLFNKEDNTQRFYIIPNQIDLNNPNPIKIHIAEGAFDILSIYLNLRKEKEHNIYAAILGSGYLNIIKHFINRLKLINIEFHFYKDNDMDNFVIYSIIELLKPYCIPVYLHINMYPDEKDFGVPLERINERIERVI